jgi:signal transduction histidine kinase
VVEERARIARELQDAVAHNVSMIVVQAGAERRVVDGSTREVFELSAYRIVQEALTNALKHAGEARASVRVHYGPDSLELEIADDGGGVPAPETDGGHGLVGMRERVALYGGRLDAGRRPTGGFAVRVLLPIR